MWSNATNEGARVLARRIVLYLISMRPKKLENVLLTIPDAAAQLGVGVRTMREAVRRKQIVGVVIGDRTLISRAEIKRLTKEKET
jgi:excisionase family DNA binding protein